MGLRRSLRLASPKKHQLDPALNHTGFSRANEALEEKINLLKETCVLKEAMNSLCETKFSEEMEKEITKHSSHKHYASYREEKAPESQVLGPT